MKQERWKYLRSHELSSTFYRTGAQAGSANVCVLRYAVNFDFDAFDVGLPHSVGLFM